MIDINDEEGRKFGRDLKIIIVGDLSTGKTSILNRYINQKFEPKSKATKKRRMYFSASAAFIILRRKKECCPLWLSRKGVQGETALWPPKSGFLLHKFLTA